jgi:hypothetical protein
MFSLPAKPYSDQALISYVKRALVLIDDMPFFDSSVVEKEIAVRSTAEAVLKLPSWMQVIMVETGQSFKAVPGHAVSHQGNILGRYLIVEKATVTPTRNKDLAYILGHEAGHHADAMLGENGYFSEQNSGWKKAVTDEFSHQRSLPTAFRYHQPYNDGQMELYSRITHGSSYKNARDREAFATLLGDYFSYLARGDTHAEIDRNLSRSLPHMWPAFRDEGLPRLASLAIEKYDAADQKHIQALVRANDDPERSNLPRYDLATESQSMHDLRARFGAPMIDRIATAYHEFGAVMPFGREETKTLTATLIEPIQAEWPHSMTLSPRGLQFGIDKKDPSLAAQFGSVCDFHGNNYISYVQYVNSLGSIVSIFSNSPGYRNERSQIDLVSADAFRQCDQYTLTNIFLTVVEQRSNDKDIANIKIFMSATDRHVGPIALLRFFSGYFDGNQLVSENTIKSQITRASESFSRDVASLAQLGTAMATSPQVRGLIQNRIDAHASQEGLPYNPISDAVSFTRSKDFKPFTRLVDVWPLALQLSGMLGDCGVAPTAVTHIRGRIALELAKAGNKDDVVKVRLGDFVRLNHEQGLSREREFRAAFLNAFAQYLPPTNDTILPPTSKWTKSWNAIARRARGNGAAQDASRIGAFNASTSTINSMRISDALVEIATKFDMTKQEAAVKQNYFAAGEKFFQQFGATAAPYLEHVYNSQNDNEIKEQTKRLAASTSRSVQDWWARIHYFSEQLREIEPAAIHPAYEARTAKQFFNIASIDGPSRLLPALEAQEVILSELVDRLESKPRAATRGAKNHKPEAGQPAI